MNTPHTPPAHDYGDLERSLESLTTGPAETPGLWRRALEASSAPATQRSLFSRPLAPRWLITATAAAILFVISVAAIVPNLGQARMGVRAPSSAAAPVLLGAHNRVAPDISYKMPDGQFTLGDGPSHDAFRDSHSSLQFGEQALQAPSPSAEPIASIESRQVVRKSTLELESPDIPAAFAKAAHSLSEARGEYIENSSLTGEGPAARATLTLRIASDRLSAALNDLRPLGKVLAESTTGEDVTSQAVDLDARIRNEQRVEAELLALLEKRAEAPLKEILDLRQSLASVRENIERLDGQRQHLSRLVGLATVLVIIRPPDPMPAPAPARSSLWSDFQTSIAGAWTTGLSTLADTVALILKIAVGGIIWWLLAALLVAATLRHHRRALARGV